jgi:hypothetical protein
VFLTSDKEFAADGSDKGAVFDGFVDSTVGDCVDSTPNGERVCSVDESTWVDSFTGDDCVCSVDESTWVDSSAGDECVCSVDRVE